MNGRAAGIVTVGREPNGMASLFGMPIIECPNVPDDTVWVGEGQLFVGTLPPDTVKLAGREARLIVRRGLADVLAWLGQPVENEPVLAAIRNGVPR